MVGLETKYRDIADGNVVVEHGNVPDLLMLETKYRDIADGNSELYSKTHPHPQRWKPSTAI